MVLRKLTWINWIEVLVGATLPTIFLGRFAWGWFVTNVYFLMAAMFGTADLPVVNSAFGVLLSGIWVGAIALLWVLPLMGVEWINRHPVIRWVTVVCDVVGSVFGIVLLWGMVFWKLTNGRQFSWHEHGIWLTLIGPIALGFRYLPALIRGNRVRHVV